MPAETEKTNTRTFAEAAEDHLEMAHQAEPGDGSILPVLEAAKVYALLAVADELRLSRTPRDAPLAMRMPASPRPLDGGGE